MKYSLLLIVAFCLVGCAGLGDYDIDLPNDYSIIRTSADNVTIAPKTGEGMWGENVVPSKVTEVGWNDDFILAKQINMNNEQSSYWMIELPSGQVEGPMSYENFQQMRVDLQLEDIPLQEVSDLR